MGAAAAQNTQELRMKTTRFKYKGKETIVGLLRRFKDDEKLTAIEAHRLIAAINAKFGTNIRLIRPGVADFLFNKTSNWKEVEEGFPSPTHADIAYEKLGNPLGAEIIYAPEDEPRLIVPTGKYKGEKDIALVLMNLTINDFKLDGNDLLIDVPDSRIVPVRDFPRKNGWHMPHAETTVPHGDMVEYSVDARYLRRLDFSYAGALVRGVVVFEYYWQGVDAGCRPSYGFGG